MKNNNRTKVWGEMFSFVMSGGAIFLALIYVIFCLFVPPTTPMAKAMLAIIACVSLGVLFGQSWRQAYPKYFRKFQGETENLARLESDLLRLYLDKTTYKFPSELHEKLALWELSDDASVKAQLFSEITALLDKELKGKTIQAKLDKPLRTRERETLLILIAAFAKEAKYDVSKEYKTAGSIEKVTQEMGCPLSETTIAQKLELIPDALESRAK